MRKFPFAALLLASTSVGAQTLTGGSSGGATGVAGGSLSGTYPNPTVATNANLTGPITSVGNATSIASQTGTGSTFVMQASPTIAGTLTTSALTANGLITLNAGGLATSLTANSYIATPVLYSSAIDAAFYSPAANTWRFGNAPQDLASPPAQTLGMQSVAAGTSNTAGSLWTFTDSAGTGTGLGGGISWKVHPAGTTGTVQNAAVVGMNLTQDGISFGATTIPVVTGTGSPTIATGSTDTAGEVTSGTSATSVVITFGHAKTNAPFCNVTPQSVLLAFSYTISNTAITITQTATSAEKIDYYCTQH